MSEQVAYWKIVGQHGFVYARRYEKQEHAQAILDAFGPISGRVVGFNASGKVVESPAPLLQEQKK